MRIMLGIPGLNDNKVGNISRKWEQVVLVYSLFN